MQNKATGMDFFFLTQNKCEGPGMSFRSMKALDECSLISSIWVFSTYNFLINFEFNLLWSEMKCVILFCLNLLGLVL